MQSTIVVAAAATCNLQLPHAWMALECSFGGAFRRRNWSNVLAPFVLAACLASSLFGLLFRLFTPLASNPPLPGAHSSLWLEGVRVSCLPLSLSLSLLSSHVPPDDNMEILAK